MSSEPVDPLDAAISPIEKKTAPRFGLRWVICGLLFFATTINYVDRVTMSVMESTLQKAIGWDEFGWGFINASFMAAYAVGSLLAGWMIDRLGTRVGFSISLILWSVMSAGACASLNTFTFIVARFALGIGESGNFPGAIKTTAEWFPKKERATATGIFNSGSNFGPIMAAIVVPIIALKFGWQCRIRRDRARGTRCGSVLVADLSSTPGASVDIAGRTGVHRKRSTRSSGKECLGNSCFPSVRHGPSPSESS